VPINQDHRRFGITLEGTDMGRHSLRIIMVLGALVTLVGGTGIFAVFSDRATGGENTVTSGTRPKSADLRIEPAVLDAAGGFNCDGDVDGSLFENDDTTTAQFTVTDAQPGNSLGDAYVCLKNVGSAVLALSVSAIDVVDVDTDCTGDEAISGDTTCGLDLASLEPGPASSARS
jgi:predicted ribosomally synthesized peptide with SipW-like signal peptide